MIALSVVIPTCNRPEQLAECLKRVAPKIQGFPDGAYEVIVTDDGRRQPVKAFIESEFPWVRWVQGPARGPSANRNNGANKSNADWLVFIDDDCLADPDWLRQFSDSIRSLADDQMIAIQGATIRAENPPSLLWEAPHDPEAKGRITANFAIRRSDYLALNGLDERYPLHFEDTEFFARMNAAGGLLINQPRATVVHPLRRVPGACTLGNRWKGRVVYALDQGMSPMTILWRLPLHVAKVIPTRFRGADRSGANVKAALLFFLEWLQVLAMTPAWVVRLSKQERSVFWRRFVADGGGIPHRVF